jgi:diguanylate cyclase (GGDEF)-like protein
MEGGGVAADRKDRLDKQHDEAADDHDAEALLHDRSGWDWSAREDPEKANLDARDASVDRVAAEVDRDRARLERHRKPTPLTSIEEDPPPGGHDRHRLEPPDQAGQDRDRTAEDRDRRAEAHDRVSEARDERADARDERAEARERVADADDTAAAADRGGAKRDRQGGASDRGQAADDRHAASADRWFSARERATFAIDQLTGAHRRDVGFVELEREIDRAKRTNQPFALAFVDVDHLKARNDSRGHTAGDQLLRATAEAIRAQLRSYDLIIRFGGDEFLCGVIDVTVAEAAKRFARANAELATTQQATITVGLAQLEQDDVLEDLVARADQDLYRERQDRNHTDEV